MSLPSSPISMSQLNVEMGRTSTTPLSLGSLSGNSLIDMNYFRGQQFLYSTLVAAQLSANRVGYSTSYVPSGSMSPLEVEPSQLTVNELMTINDDGDLFLSVFGSTYGFNTAGNGADLIILPSGGGVYKFPRSSGSVGQAAMRWPTNFRFSAGATYTIVLTATSSPY